MKTQQMLHTGEFYWLPSGVYVRAEPSLSGGWLLYSGAEWEQGPLADYEVQPDGTVTAGGEPTPWCVDDLRLLGA